MSTNVRKFVFLVIFDTCDIVYNWFISLLPPIVLDNLFGIRNIVFLRFYVKDSLILWFHAA